MAIGLSMIFNISLPQNFKNPYIATSLIDFWKRWHITLTLFLTNYIYTAIYKKIKYFRFNKAMIVTLLTFFISGIWHGASWMFVIFGLLHGLGIIVNHYWRRYGIKLNFVLGWVLTFNYVNMCFVFFRAKEINNELNLLYTMYNPEKMFYSLRFFYEMLPSLGILQVIAHIFELPWIAFIVGIFFL